MKVTRSPEKNRFRFDSASNPTWRGGERGLLQGLIAD